MKNPLISVIFCINLIICISVNYTLNLIILIILVFYTALNEHVLAVMKAILRIRWILITVLLITSINQPGELIQPVVQILPVNLTPTYEGVYQGILQGIRLVCMMIVISLMTSILKRNQLISAFYQLLLPLTFFNLNTERAAARLCLTLEYMQKPVSLSQFLTKLRTLKQNAENIPDAYETQIIRLEIFEFNKLDFTCIFFSTLLPFLVFRYYS